MDKNQILEALRTLELAALSGDVSKSASDIVAVGAMFPEDIDIRHRTGVALTAHGLLDEAEEQFRKALAIRPRFAYSELELGNVYLRRGAFDEAAQWFDIAISSKPDFALGHFAAARLAKSRGQHLGSLLYLESANLLWPEGQEVLHDFVDMLVYHNRRYQAASAIARASTVRKLTVEETRRLLSLLSETGRYADVLDLYAALAIRDGHGADHVIIAIQAHARLALSVSKDQIIIRAAARESAPVWRDSLAVHDSIRAAIDGRTPFSVIRLGDGEARFLIGSETIPDQILTPAERFMISDEVWRNWFGFSIADVAQDQLAELRAALNRAIVNSDILGVPTALRLAGDFYHFGYLACMIRSLEEGGTIAETNSLSDAFLNLNLHRDDRFFSRLLGGLDWIGAISPHPDFARLLAAHLEIPRWADFMIPGDRQLPRHILDMTTQRHFPDRYHELMSSLQLPRQGAVVLVAAGLLGKIYCEKIKSLGGIAIDIGSVADGWMGYNTRAGLLEDTALWRLPSLQP